MKYNLYKTLTLFFAFFFYLKTFACDESTATLVSETDNGNGTYTYVIQVCNEMLGLEGIPDQFTFTFSGGTVTSIISRTPTTVTTSGGDNYTSVISGLVLTYNLQSVFAAHNSNLFCNNYTITTNGRPANIAVNTNTGSSPCVRNIALPTCTSPSAPTVNNVSYCQNISSSALTATPSSGGTLNWYGTNATGGTASTTAPNPATTSAGTFNYYVSQTVGGCEGPRAQIVVTISAAPGLTISNQTNPSCSSSTGSFIVNPNGGAGAPYTISLNGGAYGSTTSFNSLAAGTYQVTVKDASGCISAVTNVNLVSASAPSLTISNQTNPQCNSTNGAFTITASGGSGSGYTYSINNGVSFSATNNLTGLAAGTYQVVVKDGAGCTSAATTVTLTTPASVDPTYTGDSTNVTCNGANNGTITINGTSAGITYSWVSGPITSPVPAGNLPAGASDEHALINLSPGTYCVDIGGPAPGTSTVTILTETFEDNGANWTIDNSTGANIFVINNNYTGGSCVTGAGTFTVPVVPNQPAAVTAGPNSKYLHIKATTTTGVTCGAGSSNPFPPLNANFDGATSDQKATLNTIVTTTGYSNVTVTFYWLGKGDASGNDYAVLEYSLNNGSTWVQNGGKLFNQTSWKLETMTNAAWNNAASIKFRFRWRNNASSSTDPPVAIDQFVVKGDITNQCTNIVRECFTITEPAAVNAVNTVNDTICQGDPSVSFQANGSGTLSWYTASTGGTASAATPTQSSATAGTYTYYVSQTINGCEGPRTPVSIVVKPTLKPVILLTGTTASSASFNWANVSGATSYNISYYINNGSIQNDNTTSNTYTVNGLADGDSVTIIATPIGTNTNCYLSDTAYTVLPSVGCGSCINATCPIAGPYTSFANADNNTNHCSQINVLGSNFTNGTYVSYHTLTASQAGEVGAVISIGFNTSGGPCNETKSAVLYPVGNCSSPINPTSINPNGGTKYNPEWTGLTPGGTYVLLVTITIPAGCDMLDHCESYYHPPLPQMCGSCTTPTCPIGHVASFEDRTYDTCNTNINITGPEAFTQYHLVTADAGGMVGLAQLVQSVGTVTRDAYLLPVNNCNATPILPSETWVHSDVVGSGFNPEWYGLTPGAQYVLVINFNIPAGVTLDYTCADYYGMPLYCGNPGITINSTNFNCTDTAVSLNAYEPNLAGGFSVPAVTLEIFDVNAVGNNITLGIMEGPTVAGNIPVSFAGNQYYAADLFWWDPTDPFGISITDVSGGSDYFYRVIEYGTGKVLAWGHVTFTAGGTVVKSNLCSTSGTASWSIDGVLYGTGISDGINHASGEAILNPSLLSLGNHTITYYWNNGLTGPNACADSASINITISGTVSQPSIGGSNLVCANDSNINYTVQFNSGSTYVWTVPNGVNILNGQGTNSINVNWGNASGQIYCVETNNCGTSPADTFIVNVQTIVPLSPIVGTLSVCPFTSNLNYSVNNPNPGSTFSWSISGGTIVSGNNCAA